MRGTTRLAVLVLGTLITAAPLPASGSCAAPFITLIEAVERLEIRGQAFVGGGCQDACACTGVGGCQRCDCGPPPEPVVQVVVQLLDAKRHVIAEREVVVADGGFLAELPASGAGVTVTAVGRTADGDKVVTEQVLPPSPS